MGAGFIAMKYRLNAAVNLWAMMGGICLVIIIALTGWNVAALTLNMALRDFGIGVRGLYGYEDLVRLLASIAALSFFPICQLRGGHVAVGVLVDSAPRPVQRANRIISYLLTLAIALFLTWWTVKGALEVRRDGLTTGVIEWPQWPFYLAGAVSMVLWALVSASMLITEISEEEPRHGSA